MVLSLCRPIGRIHQRTHRVLEVSHLTGRKRMANVLTPFAFERFELVLIVGVDTSQKAVYQADGGVVVMRGYPSLLGVLRRSCDYMIGRHWLSGSPCTR